MVRLNRIIVTIFGLALTTAATAQDNPAEPTAPVASAPDAITSKTSQTIEIVRLPDGRLAYAFSGDMPLPPQPENADKITLPDGRIAYAFVPQVRNFIPIELTEIIAKSDQDAVLTTGLVNNKQSVATIGYTYKKAFRTKSDIIVKPLFSKPKVAVPTGAIGFYSGKYSLARYSPEGPTHVMLCVFLPANKNPYQSPYCYLRPIIQFADQKFISISTYTNIPRSFSIATLYGNPQYTYADPFQTEDGDFKIDHAFTLNLSVNKWKKEGVELFWKSEDSVVYNEILAPNADGVASLDVNGGTLTFKPDPAGDADKSLVTFVPKAEPSAS